MHLEHPSADRLWKTSHRESVHFLWVLVRNYVQPLSWMSNQIVLLSFSILLCLLLRSFNIRGGNLHDASFQLRLVTSTVVGNNVCYSFAVVAPRDVHCEEKINKNTWHGLWRELHMKMMTVYDSPLSRSSSGVDISCGHRRGGRRSTSSSDFEMMIEVDSESRRFNFIE